MSSLLRDHDRPACSLKGLIQMDGICLLLMTTFDFYQQLWCDVVRCTHCVCVQFTLFTCRCPLMVERKRAFMWLLVVTAFDGESTKGSWAVLCWQAVCCSSRKDSVNDTKYAELNKEEPTQYSYIAVASMGDLCTNHLNICAGVSSRLSIWKN